MTALQLVGKKALVTGGQQGIGRAIALRFAREGADIALNYLDDDAAAKTAIDEIAALGRTAFAVQADISKGSELARLVDETYARLGDISILVNNAAIFPRANFLEIPEAMWDATFAVNLRAACFTSQAVARRMVTGGAGGAIVNLSSSAIQGLPRSAHYVATKAAVIGLTRTMAIELAAHGIRVNTIAPGLTDTAQPRLGHTDEEIEAIGRAVPLGRIGRPDEIAAAAAFLVSDAASYITGQTLHVNGGAYMA